MRRKAIYLIIMLVFPFTGKAQHDLIPLSSLYMFNGLTINPAYAGSHEVLSTVFTYRRQWLGFSGAPSDQTFALHSPFSKNQKKDNFMALGLQGMFENSPIIRNSEIYLDYAFHIKLPEGKLALGLQAGINMAYQNNNERNIRSLAIYGIEDPAFQGSERLVIPNFGFGTYYYTDRFYIGVSVPRFFTFPSDTTKSSGTGAIFDYNRMNFLGTGGYVFTLDDNFRFKPSFMLRYQPSSGFQTDLNASFILFKDILWIGISYRTDGTLIALTEIQINSKIKIGYAYDYFTGAIGKYTSGSHEFLLRYELNYRIKAVNPKFF